MVLGPIFGGAVQVNANDIVGIIPMNKGGTGADLSAPDVDCFLRVGTGENVAYLEEVDSNYGSPGPSFTNVSTINIDTATINSLAAPSQGTYTPTYTNVANVATFGTVSDLYWEIIGNQLEIFGRISIDPTTASIATSFRISLPPGVTSNFSLFTQAGGTLTARASASLVAAVTVDTTNDVLLVEYTNTAETGAKDFSMLLKCRINL